ncbi:hypothetical protein DH2020_041811 [Rehmannia glutinosa]|uniref:Cysteine-rich receptor-like protein kinase n=1 Tax=Rehmannia glutinosa TaxID=99300 RepID=A0ABR0UP45_REHGL
MLSAFIFLVLLANLLPFIQSICLNNGNYTNNSTYKDNLNAVISSLPTYIDGNGFYNASVGQNPDRANAIALCRGDVQLPTCHECIQNIIADLLTQCPNQKQAMEWYDQCMLRYSNENILGTLVTSPGVWAWSVMNATSYDLFKADLGTLLDNLRGRAASGGPLRKVAAANVTAPDFQSIFALVQCTPDLSSEDCSRCLIEAALDIPSCCDGKRGGRVFWPSCNIRFETYSFYNETRLQELALPLLGKGDGKNTTRIVIIIVVSIVACVILVVFVGIMLRKRIKRKPRENPEIVDDIRTTESLKYALSTIRDATNDFSNDNKLGQGGFGAVYKGKLPNGEEIAVKRLSKDSGQGDLEFKNEVLLLAKLQHRNLVRLLDPTKRTYLDWERCYKIIGGIARGILYLHEDSQLRIIHRDLKPSNVLLDGSMNPKIADFGMTRLFGQDESQEYTNKIVGTYGYMAPEYAMHGQFSIKSDVFSFGVLVLEIISGRRNNCLRRGENVEDLLSFVWKNWRNGTTANIVDPFLGSSSDSMSDMMRCIHTGLLCVQENAADRPAMASIIHMLNSSSLTLPVPTEPAFYLPSDYGSNTSLLQEHNLREPEYNNSSKSNILAQYDHSSRNDASITDLYPR